MSGLADIEQLLHPTVIDSLRDGMAPVQCRVWRGDDDFDEIELSTLFPFDTLDTLKRSISLEYKDDTRFLPPFLFVGLEYEGEVFLPLEYIWYPQGVQKASRMIYLPDPRSTGTTPIKEFVVRGGGVPTPAANPRGRTTIEDVFGSEGVPVLQVFPLHRLLRAYKGTLGDAEWYQRFYPYFPAVPAKGPYTPSKEDERFGRTIIAYLLKRNSYMAKINGLIEGNVPLPELKVTGVKQLRLVLQETEDAFEDCETLFYKTKVTDARPYMRILPAEGMPVSKVLVKGILPIPALDNPDIIQQWAKEISPTMGKDYITIKYVHRPSIGTTCPIYGSVRVFSDGTADLLLQPPKAIAKLNPVSDFRHFSTTLDDVFDTLPFDKDAFEIGEAALIFQLETEAKAPKFTKAILKKRLPFFGAFFQEITPLKDTLLSLRYKAISQFASEDNLFAFLTQYATAKKLEGDTITPEMLTTLQEEFQLSALDGRRVIENWLSQGSTLTVTVPEENEFMEAFNPGIDIHIYPQHPFYTFHVHRVDSYKTFQRIYTLLALLFSEEEDRFTTTEKGAATLAALSAKVEETTLANEKGLKGVTEEEEAVPEKGTRLRSFLREEEDEPVVAKGKSKVKDKPESESKINPTGWLIKKLQSIDNTIFAYTPTIKDKQYSRVCQAHDDKHPAALTPDQYKRMVAEYKPEIDRGELFFNVYPLERGQKEPMAGVGSILVDAKEVVVSRYGSDPANENYYFCPEFFCLKDEIMVLETDFDAEVDRDGNEKEKHTCPFCGGKEVNSAKAVAGATVIRREGKSGEDAPLFIGFTKTTFHPDKYALPCCHIKKKTLRIMQPDFERVRTIVKGREESITLPVEEVSASKAAASEEIAERSRADVIRSNVVEATAYKSTVNFNLKFENLWKEYIVDPVKHPLEPGKFAMLPSAFDAYFAQKSDSFIQRAGIRQELKSLGAGFLRVGTQIGLLSASCGTNPKPTESLLGVLAPLLFKNSIEDVRELILKSVTGPNGVEIFVNANFGNLVNEFYVPSDPDLGVLRDDRNLSDLAPDTKGTNVHIKWAKANLRTTVTDDNQYAINRIFKSYNRFLAFMKDTSKRKDLRHFTSFLAEPGILTSNIKRGLQIIVLEWTPGSDGNVEIKCAPYGFSTDHHKHNDFAFVWRDNQGFYELILYTRNEPADGGDIAKHDYKIRWKASERKTWPRIVQDRVQEFMTQCKSNYRSLYTPQSGIDSMALIPLSAALQTPIRMGTANVYPTAILRDSYNHAVMVLYPMTTDPVHEDTPLVPMPIVDDGKLALGERLILDINDFEKAPAEQLLEFYATHIVTTFPLYPGYAVKYISTKTSTSGKERVAGVQLQNGIRVPSARETKGADLGAYERKPAKVMEWDINRELAKPCGEAEIKDSSTKKLEELYQYFRFMVSNWLAKDAGPTVRKEIEHIVFSRLPEFEKRKRLEILCGNFVRGSEDGWLQWMAPDDKVWDMPGGFLRKDCRVLDKGSCSAPCVWAEKEGKCKLHVDETTEIGTDRTVNTRILFSRRLIDELIRFPNRRRELMQQGVSHMSTLAEPVRDGDQYIIPERGTSWLNLLRLDWMAKDKETPLFYEEMAQQEEGKEVASEALPAALISLVGTTPYQLWKGDLKKTLGSDLGAKDDPIPSEDALQSFVKTMGKPIGLINLMDSSIKFYRPKGTQEKVTVIVFDKDGLSLLVEDPSQPYITVSTMGRLMKEAWASAAIKAPKLLRRAISFAPNTKPASQAVASQAPSLSAKPLTAKPKKLVRRISAIPEGDEARSAVESPLRVLQTPTVSAAVASAAKESNVSSTTSDESNASSATSEDIASAFAASEAKLEESTESEPKSVVAVEPQPVAEAAPVVAEPQSVAEAAPVAEALIAETSPVAEASIAEALPAAEAPVAEAPVAEAPVAEASIAEAPVAEASIAEAQPQPQPQQVAEAAVAKASVLPVAEAPVPEPPQSVPAPVPESVPEPPKSVVVPASNAAASKAAASKAAASKAAASKAPSAEIPAATAKQSVLEKVKPLNPSATASKRAKAAKLISLND